MRKGSTSVIKAFLEGYSKRLKNDSTNGKELRYHGNVIAYEDDKGDIILTLAGYNTVSTRLRLNNLLKLSHIPARFTQKDFAPYFNGKLINAYDTFRIEDYR